MRLRWSVMTVVGGLTAWACVDITPLDGQCLAACRTAARCRLLPSALGGSIGFSKVDNEDDCFDRCMASDTRTPQVAGLLELLAGADDPNDERTLCERDGVDDCEELIEQLDANPATSELEVTTELTVRMGSATSFVTAFGVEQWCCFDYQYDLDDTPDPGLDPSLTGDGVDEVAAVYDIITETHACFEALDGLFEGALMQLPPAMPPEGGGEPEPAEGMPEVCADLLRQWDPALGATLDMTDPMDLDPADDECRFARMTSTMTSLEIGAALTTCSRDTVQPLEMALQDTIRDWELDEGGLLVDVGGQVRSAEAIRRELQFELRDELQRPMGLLENACDELEEELLSGGGQASEGTDLCELIDRTPPGNDECPAGPLCSPADCLVESPFCDARLCDADLTAPGRDCGFFGITEVRLGYRTDKGLEVFGDPIDGCSARTEVATVFEDVRVGFVTPVALVSGQLATSFDPDGESTEDGTFSWYVEGKPRWVSAGRAEIELASPLLQHLEFLLENPLEALGWVPRRLPIGQACDAQPSLCEGFFNDNCEDGIDNDGDGVVDGAGAWCDGLYQELIERCVVAQPGRRVPRDCPGYEGGGFDDDPNDDDGGDTTGSPSSDDGPGSEDDGGSTGVPPGSTGSPGSTTGGPPMGTTG